MTKTAHRPIDLLAVGVLALLAALMLGLTASPSALGASKVRLHVEPASAPAGSKVTFRGTGFAARRTVTLYIGPPRSEGVYLGSTRTDAHGSFRLRRTLARAADPGRYVAIACQRDCRVKASASMRITAARTRSARAARRKPTSSEASAIRRAALRTLHGSGWHVSAIRVSTVRAVHRYASAAVDNSQTGVGGEMLLRRDGSRWRRVFLGTDDFCHAAMPTRVLRDLGFDC